MRVIQSSKHPATYQTFHADKHTGTETNGKLPHLHTVDAHLPHSYSQLCGHSPSKHHQSLPSRKVRASGRPLGRHRIPHPHHHRRASRRTRSPHRHLRKTPSRRHPLGPGQGRAPQAVSLSGFWSDEAAAPPVLPHREYKPPRTGSRPTQPATHSNPNRASQQTHQETPDTCHPSPPSAAASPRPPGSPPSQSCCFPKSA